MEQRQHGDRQLVADIDAAFDQLVCDRLRLDGEAEQLAWLEDAVRIANRARAWAGQVAAEVEASQAAWNAHRTSTTTYLTDQLVMTPGEARQLVKAGQGLAKHPGVAAAALAGTMLPEQAAAITAVMAELPVGYDADEITRAEQLLVGFAGRHNSRELRHLGQHLVDVITPEIAEAREARLLERQERVAQQRRFLDFLPDGEGSVLIRGSLPTHAAEPFIRIVNSYAAAQKRAVDALDPQAERLSPGMRRADGLLALVGRHAQDALAPSHGGDRPRIVITLSHDKLVQQAVDAGLGTRAGTAWGARLVRNGELLPASAVRRLLCDADILPVVLGGASEILDVGRTQRLVTGPIRAALDLRDQGCIFPGCDQPPENSQAHHLIPWWAGGRTSLANLVLVCAHHHGIVEPRRHATSTDDQWIARIGPAGTPEVVPPRRVDPQQRPRSHSRFTTPRRQ